MSITVDRLQPLDISVNKSCKDFMKKQFVDWYALQSCDGSADDMADFIVDLRSIMKPLGHLLFQILYISARSDVVFNGFKAAGIAEALNYNTSPTTNTPPSLPPTNA